LASLISCRKLLFAGALSAIAVMCVSAASDPLVDLKAGSVALDAKRYAAAISLLEPLGKRLPKLADYSAWFLASAQFGVKNYSKVPATLEVVWKQKPPSPLAARAYILAAQAYEQSGAPNNAVEILRKNYALLPQPQGDLALATAFGLAGDAVSAAVYNQRVYYGFPASTEAGLAEAEIARLKTQLGDNYPPSMANSMLSRALKLLEGGQTPRAKKELEALVPQLGGGDRDVAMVSVGVAEYNAKETDIAHRYLASLQTSSPDADAERLYYLLLSAQRLNNQDEAGAMADRLGQLYPSSPWRLKAVVALANHYLVLNQMEQYEPLFRACYESFAQDPQAAVCHWKVVWGHYLRRRPDAPDLLRAHLRLFPAAESASAALYFLGRLAEDAHDTRSARTFFDEVVREYPNQYYASQAREHIAAIPDPATAPSVTQFLKSVTFPQRVRTLSFQAASAASARIERARMLVSGGLEDWASGELRFGAQTEDQPHVLAMELASLSSPTMPDQAIRYIKRYASNYLFLPIESAPRQFWTLAFPLPYRADLDRFSKQNGLDPFLMAALIRQESQFDPTAVSRANARGLTQIMPATGKELSRRLKIKVFTTASLFQPSVNLELGTFYLKTLTSQVNGHTEAALAAYDAGLTRARAWLTWGDFREPAEFIETVPFSETRDYVQTVLRNADVYRRLYN
jgi:soluble lytic murein transglycosylase